MSIRIRELDPTCENEIDLIVSRAMDTVLETIPEFKNSRNKAHSAFGNFTQEQMKCMFKGTYENPDHCTLLALNDSNEIIGHSIFSVKLDPKGMKFGYCYSRYVAPEARRQGVASALLKAQEKWWAIRGIKYAKAETHFLNQKLQDLFKKHGYFASELIQGKHFPFVILKKYFS